MTRRTSLLYGYAVWSASIVASLPRTHCFGPRSKGGIKPPPSSMGFACFPASVTMGLVDVPGKLRAWWADMREWRAGKHFEINCDDSGVALISTPPRSEPPLQLRWEQIKAVFAYKRDCYTVDQIRLILRNDVEMTWMEVTEDDVGFKVLIVELARRLPGFPNVYDWWDKVAQPPFETQWTALYRRSAPNPQVPDRTLR
jgi:hypothetical protein